MTKRFRMILSTLCALALLLTCLPAGFANEAEGDAPDVNIELPQEESAQEHEGEPTQTEGEPTQSDEEPTQPVGEQPQEIISPELTLEDIPVKG